MKPEPEKLIPKHGGYRKLKSFQVAQLAYDVTVRFCDLYISPRSRTHDQMVQAARSGVQNIAEGSQASGTSKKTELKLTNVARASLEELRLDYEDYLRQRGLAQWPREDARREALIAARPATADDVAAWAKAVHGEPGGLSGRHGPSGQSRIGPKSTASTKSTVSTPTPRSPRTVRWRCSQWPAHSSTARSPHWKRTSWRKAVSPSASTACEAHNATAAPSHERSRNQS